MSPCPLFRNRTEAGDKLAERVVSELGKRDDAQGSAKQVVYALPRGGLPVAAPVARLLGCPLDVVVAKKIARPENPELAIGVSHSRWPRTLVAAPLTPPAQSQGAGGGAASRSGESPGAAGSAGTGTPWRQPPGCDCYPGGRWDCHRHDGSGSCGSFEGATAQSGVGGCAGGTAGLAAIPAPVGRAGYRASHSRQVSECQPVLCRVSPG